jgi:hypothetical protein
MLANAAGASLIHCIASGSLAAAVVPADRRRVLLCMPLLG